jgi:hypothetical protein
MSEAALEALPLRSRSAPGRACPTSYLHSPRDLDREPELEAATLYAVGGLYGNLEALDAVEALARTERGPVALVFNGDFHWFDVAPDDFAEVSRRVLAHRALRGNVETEIAGEESEAGCGCGYPESVGETEVERSNEILRRLRETGRSFPRWREALRSLPMHLVARVGDARVALLHGDAGSLAGWGFAHDRLDDPGRSAWIADAFRQSGAHVFASSHTCLPAMRRYEVDGGTRSIVNNGAAGMPNFAGTRHGIVTRIGVEPREDAARLYATRVAGSWVEALRVDYDHARWLERFRASWPPGSSAHESYHGRIVGGPRYALERARPGA